MPQSVFPRPGILANSWILRTLVIVMDPQSQTSPKPILDRWKDLIDITFWKDSDFATQEEYQKALAEVQAYFGHSRITPSLARHRTRQRLFYFKCLQKCQKRLFDGKTTE